MDTNRTAHLVRTKDAALQTTTQPQVHTPLDLNDAPAFEISVSYTAKHVRLNLGGVCVATADHRSETGRRFQIVAAKPDLLRALEIRARKGERGEALTQDELRAERAAIQAAKGGK